MDKNTPGIKQETGLTVNARNQTRDQTDS